MTSATKTAILVTKKKNNTETEKSIEMDSFPLPPYSRRGLDPIK